MVIPSYSSSLSIKLTQFHFILHGYAFAPCLHGDPSPSAFDSHNWFPGLLRTCRLLLPLLMVSFHTIFLSGPTPPPFHFLLSLPRSHPLQQLPNKHTQKKCIFRPCLSETAFHTWWIPALNIKQSWKAISPQDCTDGSTVFSLVVLVCFACCWFCLFYFH